MMPFETVSNGEWRKLSDPFRGKLQVALHMGVSEGYAHARVEFSRDGIEPLHTAYELDWKRNSGVKPGWPPDGPAMRVDSWMQVGEDKHWEPWMDGLYYRVIVTSDDPYTIEVGEMERPWP